MNKSPIYYDKKHVEFLETLWGKGYLSPGGKSEVEKILSGSRIQGKNILDLGCGSGGVTISLCRDFGAQKITGIDIEEPVCEIAKKRVEEFDLGKKIKIIRVEPGTLPFNNNEFDIVFSKDSMVHIKNKELIIKEISRVLKPGGKFLASDWCIRHDSELSTEMAYYLELEDLGFEMASPRLYQNLLLEAGFENIILENRNSWYLEEAQNEVALLSGQLRTVFENKYSKEYTAISIKTWNAMIEVLKTGEHCPHHIKAGKPAR